jgi:penicillin-binding protein 1A
MTDMLQSTVTSGTLRYAASTVGGFDMPTAGKTGTTQNWSDAWTVGFTPYVTTAIWFGFDRGGSNSLGTDQTGATTTGPVWARYMKAIHEGLAPREFEEPGEGLVRVEVSRQTGLLPTENFSGQVIEEIFIAGTQPQQFDQRYEFEREQEDRLVDRLRQDLATRDLGLQSLETAATPSRSAEPLEFRLDFELPEEEEGALEFGDPEEEESNPLLD